MFYAKIVILALSTFLRRDGIPQVYYGVGMLGGLWYFMLQQQNRFTLPGKGRRSPNGFHSVN